MNPLDIRQLPFSSKASICWSFFWRSIAVAVASSLCGALLGGIFGFAFGLAGIVKAAPLAGAVLGVLCGAYFLYILVRWLLSSRLGGFRLLLVHADENA